MKTIIHLLLSLLLTMPVFAQDDRVPLTPDNAAQVVQIARLGRGVIREAVWSPDGDQIAVASTIGVWLYDANALDNEPRLLEGQTGVSSVAFSPDSLTLASGGDDGSVVLWDTASADVRLRLENHIYPVDNVAFSPDGLILASADHSGVLRLWEAATGVEKYLIERSESIRDIAFNLDGTRLAVAGNDMVNVWDTATSDLLAEEILDPQDVFYGESIEYVAFSGNDLVYTTWSTQGRFVWIWAFDSVAEPYAVPIQFAVLDAFSGADSATILYKSGGSQVGTWDTETRTPIELIGDELPFLASTLTSDRTRLLNIVTSRGDLRVWDTATDEVQELGGFSGRLLGIEFSVSGSIAASIWYDQIALWDSVTQTLVTTFETTMHREPSPPIAFSPDGLLLAEGRDDSVVYLRQNSTGEEVAALYGHIRGVTSVAFSPDGRLLASGSLDGTVRLWNVETREPLAVLEGHTGGVTGIAFSHDGALLASSSYDGTVRLWSLP